jgi:hypothetical protein
MFIDFFLKKCDKIHTIFDIDSNELNPELDFQEPWNGLTLKWFLLQASKESLSA